MANASGFPGFKPWWFLRHFGCHRVLSSIPLFVVFGSTGILKATSYQKSSKSFSGWWFQIFLFSSLPGEMIQFDYYFSNGLKPPTSFGIVWIDMFTFYHLSLFKLFVFTFYHGKPPFFITIFEPFCPTTERWWSQTTPPKISTHEKCSTFAWLISQFTLRMNWWVFWFGGLLTWKLIRIRIHTTHSSRLDSTSVPPLNLWKKRQVVQNVHPHVSFVSFWRFIPPVTVTVFRILTFVQQGIP